MNTAKPNKKSMKKDARFLLYFAGLVIVLSILSDFATHQYSKEEVDHQTGLASYVAKELNLQPEDIMQISEFPWSTDTVRQFQVTTASGEPVPPVIYEKSMLLSKYKLSLQQNAPEYQTASFPPSWGYLYAPEYLPYGYYTDTIQYDETVCQILYKNKGYELVFLQKNKIDTQTVLVPGYSSLEELFAAYLKLPSQDGLTVQELEVNGFPAYYIEQETLNSLCFQNGDYRFQFVSNCKEPLIDIAKNMVKLKKQ